MGASFFLITILLLETSLLAYLRNLQLNKHFSRPFSIHNQKTIANNEEILGHVDLKVVSLNVLAPCYHNIKENEGVISESNLESRFLSRHEEICTRLRATQADVICLQEYWVGSDKLQQIYHRILCEDGYIRKELRRTSHWREREDGLAIFVRNETIEIQDTRNILFHDCGDRVALLLLLAIRPTTPNTLPQQFIVINTHLLFPHNSYSTNIRLREATKILGYAELYRQRELCTTICDRADVRLPVIVAGDFNGSPRGAVHKFIISQNFHSAVEEHMSRSHKKKWVSHKSHRKELVAVDHIFYCNPSDQTIDNLPPVPDWTNLVFREVFQKICETYGANSIKEAFTAFDKAGELYIDREQFKEALIQLGFMGEGKPSLTAEEIEVLVDSADYDGNGTIDYKEFAERFWLASNNGDLDNPMRQYFLRSKWLNQDTDDEEIDFEFISPYKLADDVIGMPMEQTPPSTKTFIQSSVPVLSVQNSLLPILQNSRPLGDLQVVESSIYPPELEDGKWPVEYSMSDHGIVQVLFRAQVMRAISEDDAIDPVPVARKRRAEEDAM